MVGTHALTIVYTLQHAPVRIPARAAVAVLGLPMIMVKKENGMWLSGSLETRDKTADAAINANIAFFDRFFFLPSTAVMLCSLDAEEDILLNLAGGSLAQLRKGANCCYFLLT